MGFLGQLFGNYLQATQYRGRARVARAQGELERAQAYTQAARREDEGKAAWILNTENAKRLREKQTAEKASARNRRGNSGFTSEGSGLQEELSVAEQLEVMIQDTALSGAIAERNAAEEARVMRVNGEIANIEAEGEAQAYEVLAKNAKRAAITQGVNALAGMGVGMLAGGIGGGSLTGAFGALRSKGLGAFSDFNWKEGLLLGGQTAFSMGSISGQFTQLYPGSVAAGRMDAQEWGADINGLWKAFGGSDLFGSRTAAPNYATGNLTGGLWTDGRERDTEI